MLDVCTQIGPGIVAICTRNWATFSKSENYREVVSQVRALLDSGYSIEMLIVENAATATGHQTESDHTLETVLFEPRIGIPYARNAALSWVLSQGALWIIFIDDDVTPSPGCLANLVAEFSESNADGIMGLTSYGYPEDYPKHYPRLEETKYLQDVPLKAGSTAVVLFRTEPIKSLGLTFSEALTEYGGSDADFFFKLYSKGFVILPSLRARVIEELSGRRTTLYWQAKRRIRTSQSWHFTIGGLNANRSGIASRDALGQYIRGIKLLGSFLSATALLIVSPVRGRRKFLDATMHLMPVFAVLLLALGIRIKEYKSRRSGRATL